MNFILRLLILNQLVFFFEEKLYRLFTGVVFPHAESLRDNDVGVGVLLLLVEVPNRVYII
jgi:hypothetical protein